VPAAFPAVSAGQRGTTAMRDQSTICRDGSYDGTEPSPARMDSRRRGKGAAGPASGGHCGAEAIAGRAGFQR